MIRCDDALVKLSDAEQAAIETILHRRVLVPRVRERLEMVKAAMLGHDLPTIARWTGRSEATVCQWLSRFLSGGSAALAKGRRRLPGAPGTDRHDAAARSRLAD
jgi:hypothetical protein